MKIIDISGQTFHDVEVLSYNEKRSGGTLFQLPLPDMRENLCPPWL